MAMMTVSASTAFLLVHTLKGRLERSILLTVSEYIFVPNRSLCALYVYSKHKHYKLLIMSQLHITLPSKILP